MIQFMAVEEKHIRQMAALLARRQERERAQFPFLPGRFEEIDETEPVIRNLLERPYISGIVAVRGIDVIGYMLYEFKGDEARGRYVFMDYSSVAVSAKEHPGLLRLLYAEAGAEWVKHGYFQHVLMTPLGSAEELQQWLDQSFRFEQKYAVLRLAGYEPRAPKQAPKLAYRRGGKEDRDLLRKVAAWNSIHQAGAPSWQPITREVMDEIRQSYAALSEEKESYFYFAEQEGRIGGFHVYLPSDDPFSLVTPERCIKLSAASTNPEFRGRGIGSALANYCFAEMKQHGFDYVAADWHSPNHLASYFWPRLGFTPVMARLSRSIDPRIAWAHGRT